MSPVPRDPVTTIVERTGKKLRAVIFDGALSSAVVDEETGSVTDVGCG